MLNEKKERIKTLTDFGRSGTIAINERLADNAIFKQVWNSYIPFDAKCNVI